MKFAIIENEFGDVGIDENILVESSEESIIEVMNGCICCTVRGDLTELLDQMYERVKDFDGVIIETTGLADPAPVAQTFFVDDNIVERYKLDGIVTVVDAKHITQHIEEEKPEGVENESVEQLAFADRIMLNKIDLVSEEELGEVENRIKSINRFAPMYHTENSIIDPKELIIIGSFDLERTLDMDPEFLDTDAEHEHDERVTSTSSKFEGALNVNKLERWIGDIMQNKGEDLFRFDGLERKFAFDPATLDNLTSLTTSQVEQFNTDGYLSPLPGLGISEVGELRRYLDWLIDEVISADDRRNSYSINQYHQVCAPLWDLIHHPLLVGYVQDILGPQLVCWSTHLFCKLPGDKMKVPMHQDANYWPFSPTKSLTVWLAVDDVTKATLRCNSLQVATSTVILCTLNSRSTGLWS